MNHAVQNPLANTIAVSAARLGVSRTTLWRMVCGGAIKTMKIGHRNMIAEAELQRYVAERMAAAGGEVATA